MGYGGVKLKKILNAGSETGVSHYLLTDLTGAIIAISGTFYMFVN